MHKDNGRKQKRDLDARLATDGRAGQQVADGGEELVVLNGGSAGTVREGGFVVVFSSLLVKIISDVHAGEVTASTLLTRIPANEKGKQESLFDFQGCVWIVVST